MGITTISVDKSTKEKISKLGKHNESFDSLLNRILAELQEMRVMVRQAEEGKK